MNAVVESLAKATSELLKWLNTFWMNVPTPDVQSGPSADIESYLSWYTIVFAVAGILVGLGRMAISREFRDGVGGITMLARLIFVTGALGTGVTFALVAGDAFAVWIVEKATGEQFTMNAVITSGILTGVGPGPGLVLALFAFLGACANVGFMVLRGALLYLLFSFMPTLAASSNTESGKQAWRKAVAWLIALVLFKPVAGVIYAIGILVVKNPPKSIDVSGLGGELYGAILGVVILICAALALPALIKFIAPIAATGTSGVFSGAGALAAVVASGAAVVSLGGTAAAAGAGATAGGMGGTSGVAMSGGAAGGAGGSVAGGGSPAGGGAGGSGAGSGGSGSGAGTAGGHGSQEGGPGRPVDVRRGSGSGPAGGTAPEKGGGGEAAPAGGGRSDGTSPANGGGSGPGSTPDSGGGASGAPASSGPQGTGTTASSGAGASNGSAPGITRNVADVAGGAARGFAQATDEVGGQD
ncbi:hypothetical protein [Isoptericola sp. NPDC055881]